MADLYTRSYNPIWDLRTLTGLPLDDTYYIFFLENTIPYQPQSVFHTPNGTPWTNPVEVTAAGTMPIDVYFDPTKIYRIEIRHGNTQQDELVWLIENYVPTGGGGDTPIDTLSLVTDNQITNPQFTLVSFDPSVVINNIGGRTIEVAPGWDLVLTGSNSNVTVERVALSSIDDVPTNAPYALRIHLTGWTSAYLRQRFQQNGTLWAEKFVAISLTARSETLVGGFNATLNYSTGMQPTVLLTELTVSSIYTQYRGVAEVSEAANTDVPPDAWTELRINLPGSIDIYLTSVQLTAASAPLAPIYEQETVERGIDQTFHYYRNSLLIQSKDSILTGWDFAMNPWQFRATSANNVTVNRYTADQTVIIQQNYVENDNQNNVSVRQASLDNQRGFQVTGSDNANKFGLLQWIDPITCAPHWGNKLSALIKAKGIFKDANDTLGFKCRLIWKAGLPSTISRTYPVASWADDGEPVLAAGWNYIDALNAPEGFLSVDQQEYAFNSFELPIATNANMTLGIFIYTLDNLDTSGDADSIVFNSVSLVPNDFAIAVNALTFGETLRRCQFYYSKSFFWSTVAATQVTANEVSAINVATGTNSGGIGGIYYPVEMRAAPTVTVFNPVTNSNSIRNTGTNTDTTTTNIVNNGTRTFAIQYVGTAGFAINQFLNFHWAANARLGG